MGTVDVQELFCPTFGIIKVEEVSDHFENPLPFYRISRDADLYIVAPDLKDSIPKPKNPLAPYVAVRIEIPIPKCADGLVETIPPHTPATVLYDTPTELTTLPEEAPSTKTAPSIRLRAMEKCDDWYRLLKPLILELVKRLGRRPYPDEVWNAAIESGCKSIGNRAETKVLSSPSIDKQKPYSSFKRTYPTWWED
jgi:hypothetical protein